MEEEEWEAEGGKGWGRVGQKKASEDSENIKFPRRFETAA